MLINVRNRSRQPRTAHSRTELLAHHSCTEPAKQPAFRLHLLPYPIFIVTTNELVDFYSTSPCVYCLIHISLFLQGNYTTHRIGPYVVSYSPPHKRCKVLPPNLFHGGSQVRYAPIQHPLHRLVQHFKRHIVPLTFHLEQVHAPELQ